MPLDAATCSALQARASGDKFELGRQACGLPPAVARAAARPSHAQQLDLYAAPPEAPPPRTPADPKAPAPPAATAPTQVRPGGAAARTRAAVPRPLPANLTRAVALAPDIDRVARDHALDPLLLHAIARVESGHNATAVSPAGARGLMQVMPATASRFGVKEAAALYDAPLNLQVSARYLKTLQGRFPGDLTLVLAAYNAGEGAVERHGRRVPPYAETQGYVQKVLSEYLRLRNAAQRVAAGAAAEAMP